MLSYKLATLALTLVLAGCVSTTPVDPAAQADAAAGLHTAMDRPSTPTVVNDPPKAPLSNQTKPSTSSASSARLVRPADKPGNERMALSPLSVNRAASTGRLENPQITELSGLAASLNTPGVLFAINDSGRKPTLFAMSETGAHLYQWPVFAKNRDWEDMTSLRINGQAYLVLADTGDNLQRRKTSTLHFLAEPSLAAQERARGALAESTAALTPVMSIDFVYEDGARNVEAVAAYQNSLFLISKEAVTEQGPAASRVYELPLPSSQPDKPLRARLIATVPITTPSLEARLAASLAGVDLNHPTALDIDASGRVAWLLTYRNVLKITREAHQSWADAFAQPGQQVLSHKLAQAEALAIASGRAVFFGSEGQFSPVWALPIKAPL